jgi:His/Glu/Gln/Arg/opine family amino acid ABC transporter permease subunit
MTTGLLEDSSERRSVQLDARNVIKLRRPWRWLGAAVILLLGSMFLHMLVTNPNLKWHVIGHYLFSSEILNGILRTLELTVLAMVFGLVLGIIVAVMRLSANPILQWVSIGWIWFFRGVPPLVQLIFWYNLASLVQAVHDLDAEVHFPRQRARVARSAVLGPGDLLAHLSDDPAVDGRDALVSGAHDCVDVGRARHRETVAPQPPGHDPQRPTAMALRVVRQHTVEGGLR